MVLVLVLRCLKGRRIDLRESVELVGEHHHHKHTVLSELVLVVALPYIVIVKWPLHNSLLLQQLLLRAPQQRRLRQRRLALLRSLVPNAMLVKRSIFGYLVGIMVIVWNVLEMFLRKKLQRRILIASYAKNQQLGICASLHRYKGNHNEE